MNKHIISTHTSTHTHSYTAFLWRPSGTWTQGSTEGSEASLAHLVFKYRQCNLKNEMNLDFETRSLLNPGTKFQQREIKVPSSKCPVPRPLYPYTGIIYSLSWKHLEGNISSWGWRKGERATCLNSRELFSGRISPVTGTCPAAKSILMIQSFGTGNETQAKNL